MRSAEGVEVDVALGALEEEPAEEPVGSAAPHKETNKR